jgi:hypothetical protein
MNQKPSLCEGAGLQRGEQIAWPGLFWKIAGLFAGRFVDVYSRFVSTRHIFPKGNFRLAWRSLLQCPTGFPEWFLRDNLRRF